MSKENKNEKPGYIEIIQALEKLGYEIVEISNRDYIDPPNMQYRHSEIVTIVAQKPDKEQEMHQAISLSTLTFISYAYDLMTSRTFSCAVLTCLKIAHLSSSGSAPKYCIASSKYLSASSSFITNPPNGLFEISTINYKPEGGFFKYLGEHD